jgi:hypothetical protein
VPDENKPRYTNEDLRGLKEEDLLEMLFRGSNQQEIETRRATYELARRQENRRTRLQLWFAGLSAIAAVGSAIAAVLALHPHL